MIYLVLGVLRLGFVTHFLSRPIISAFLTAGTIIISLSQVSLFSTTCHADLSLLCPYPDVYHYECEVLIGPLTVLLLPSVSIAVIQQFLHESQSRVCWA